MRFFQERNVISKIQNYDETVLPSLPNFDNNDANDDENDTDIFSRTDKHRTYEMPQRKQFVRHESIRTVNYSFPSTLSFNTFTFHFSCNRILCSRKLLGTVTIF